MDIKLKTSQMLLKRLESGCGDAQLHAVAEIRLFSKWDDANRTCLAQAGAVSLLLQMLRNDMRVHPRVQENAMAALLNMSINADVKLRVAREDGALDVVMSLARHGGTGELRAAAAALLYSLLMDDDAREIVCGSEKLEETLQGLLRDGSSSCKAEALKAMFVLAKEERTRDRLLQERFGLVGLLVSLLTVGKTKLMEDCLAVLALLVGCEMGAKAAMDAPSAGLILAYLVRSGTSARLQENAAAVLLSVCRNDESAKQMLPMETLVPALMKLKDEGSERGKAKSEALLRALGFQNTHSMAGGAMDSASLTDDSNLSYGSTVHDGENASKSSVIPVLPMPAAHRNYSPPRSEPAPPLDDTMLDSGSCASSSESAFSDPSAGRRRLFPSKYASLAKKVFTPKARKQRPHSII